MSTSEELDATRTGFHTKCTERDVLMGRGKRVSEWPGNVFFRQVVNKHRDEYTSAIRNKKVEIARLVIKEVVINGGRFLREVNPSNEDAATSVWVEVDEARTVEKTCQALREKEKPNTTDQSPFVGEEVAEKLLIKHRTRDELKRQKRQQKMNDVGTSNSLMNRSIRKHDRKKSQLQKKPRMDNDGSSSSSSDDSSTTSLSSFEDCEAPGLVKDDKKSSSVEGRKKQREEKVAKSANKKMIFSPARMLGRLRQFIEEHGHTAVPSNWPHDRVFADWCTAQRQLYREVVTGYRLENKVKAEGEATEQKKTDANTNTGDEETNNHDVISKDQQYILNNLRTMNFCWDYDDWHWNYRYQQLVADGSSKSTEAKLWLRDQRRQYREGGLPADRMKKLDNAGVSLV